MKRIFIDASKCDGCKNCTVACMQYHRADLTEEQKAAPYEWKNLYTIDLADEKNESRNHIVKDGKGGYIPIFCRHCDEPECVMACMSGALSKDPETGHVKYDESKCGACYMCVMNCPYGVLKADTAERVKIIRCDFCDEKEDGPSCVASCPKKAIYVEEVQ